jgi:metal-responsive CopG/Arc/MetJ family transcriptional regulator
MPAKMSLKPILLRLEKEMIEKVDDFRFNHRFESRTQAIRWLLKWALSQNPKPKK